MGFQLQMNMTYGGREPEVLSDLILRRQKVLGETADKAVIGTAITVMISLRAQTKVVDETKASYKKETDAVVGWHTVNGKRKLRVEGWGPEKKVVNLGGLHYKGNQYYVYSGEILNKGKPDTLYFIARHEGLVEAYLKRRVKKYKGMARSAWGHLMRQTSQRESTVDTVTSQARNVLKNNLTVKKGGSQYEFGVQVIDDLVYAAAALKGGPASVTHAMQAASNKIAGQIRRFIADHPTFSEQNIQIPFPEIVKPR